MRRFQLDYLLLGLLLPAACDAQATPDYQGQPLMVLSGTLESRSTSALPEADLVLGWLNWGAAEGTNALGPVYARVQVSTQLPMQFSAEIFQPPPESAYAGPGQGLAPGYTLVGPRIASAELLLARHGVTITDASVDYVNPGQVLDNFSFQYSLIYYESDGTPGLRGPDGTVGFGPSVKKGYHLIQHQTVACASRDLDCEAGMMSIGIPPEQARLACTGVTSSTNNVEVPLDTPLHLVVGGPPLASDLPPCQ